MSLTENYIVPDFYYTESGIPALYNDSKLKNPTKKYQINISKQSVNLNSEPKSKKQSFIPLSVRSPPLSSSSSSPSSSPPPQSSSPPPQSSSSTSPSLLKHSLLLKSYNYSNMNSTPIKCCKSKTIKTILKMKTTPIMATTRNRLENKNNNNNKNKNNIYASNNCCDKNNQNIFKYEIPRKLLTKRGTIYQTSENIPLPLPSKLPSPSTPSTPSSSSSIREEIINISSEKIKNIKSTELSNNNNSNLEYHNTSNCYYNCNNVNFNIFNEFENDKERKNYINNRIKNLQNETDEFVRSYQNYVQLQNQQKQQQQILTDHLNCFYNVQVKKFQQNNFQENVNNQQLDNRITYDDGHHQNYKKI